MSVIFYRTQQIVQGIWSSYVLNTYNRKVRYTILQCTEYILYMSASFQNICTNKIWLVETFYNR